MKDYQGPAYQKRDVSYENRRFNRESLSPSAKGAPYKFKSALEEKQETSRGHRPVYHHEQPWRDQPQKMIEQAQDPSRGSEQAEDPDYRVPYRERRAQEGGYNTERVRERMTPVEPEVETPPAPSYERGEELRLPQTRLARGERPQVAPAGRRDREDWPRPEEATRRRSPGRQALDEFLEEPVRDSHRQSWQSGQRDRDRQPATHEASSQRQVSDAQAKFQSLLEHGRDSQAARQQARAERFKPKELPKPYQPPQPQTVTEVGVSREILQRMVKTKDSFLLFEE